ncbi:MAG: hypothetical protein KBA46_05535, partial [Candidatus Omnitrophica bacterium]|nr:hypothetical protein [Candidatus Omnitrophota bacterium]
MRDHKTITIHWLIVLLALALGIRLWVAFGSGLRWDTGDTPVYFSFADALQQRAYVAPYLFPGYSYLIASLDHFGNRALTMIVFNIVASTLACWFVYRLSLTITESKNAAFAGLALIALYPHHINWVRYISSD